MGAEHESRPDRLGPRPQRRQPGVLDGHGRRRARERVGTAELRRR